MRNRFRKRKDDFLMESRMDIPDRGHNQLDGRLMDMMSNGNPSYASGYMMGYEKKHRHHSRD